MSPAGDGPDSLQALPVDCLEPAFVEALGEGPVVVSAPTGSGKSTRVPTWCPGPVLVVEPRRVACRSLAQRVAEVEGATLGSSVGYHVRDERRATDETRLLYATPGIVLRTLDDLPRWETVILDELHERGLETDLLLALLARRRPARLVVMSATLAGDRVARHLGGRHLRGEGRAFPVEVRHLAGGGEAAKEGPLLPTVRGLERRVAKAVAAARDLPGDILVFLPGKKEIASTAAALGSHPAARGCDVLELHGGLSLADQSRAFATGGRRKIVLATNVAETSVTLPEVGVVIDSGLVRQTRWYRDRGFLTLVPIAADSAEQRAGRAGRTGPGVCFRLWSESAQLAPRTPPEIHRESLTPLVLAAAAAGERVAELPFLDPPKEEATAAAVDELTSLGALDADGRLTERGRALFGLPLDPAPGRLLIEAAHRAEEAGRDRAQTEDATGDETADAARLLEDVVDLVSALSVDRPLPSPPRELLDSHAQPRSADPAADPGRCDAVATLVALRAGADRPSGGGPALAEALRTARRLRRAFGLSATLPEPGRPVDRPGLASVILAADPRAVHLRRDRGRRTAWAAGGPELTLARESAVNLADAPRPTGAGAGKGPKIEAIAVLATHAVGAGFRDMRLLATCAMPLPLPWLVESGFGDERLGEPRIDRGRVVARIERVWAGRVLSTREEVPRGATARAALTRLLVDGRALPRAREGAAERLRAAALARSLAKTGARGVAGPRTDGWAEEIDALFGTEPIPELEDWLRTRVEALGVESGADLELLSPEDLLPPELPVPIRRALDRDYPRRLELPDATYAIEYEPARRTATLVKTSGGRKDPPPLSFLPRFGGFRVRVRHGQMLRTIRE